MPAVYPVLRTDHRAPDHFTSLNTAVTCVIILLSNSFAVIERAVHESVKYSTLFVL